MNEEEKMSSERKPQENPFVPLDTPVSLASASERVVQTNEIGRVIGFGCHQDEQDALESLKQFAKQARENPDAASDPSFRETLHGHVQKLEEAIASSYGGTSGSQS
ncbi:hypothetical protein [Allosphingosinicella deserti]|uniref:Uncharacterized protein n=1 Tax=Allosphingosinicella deserti TaxID=2116704 RepID=A0A2P7QRA8_9SPHN|nr:hypothetical protein [Sphingomonas deserti]PSJ40502.1 hypothetical protein C7I55_09205 [Sphingomonas deserti]